MRSFTGKVFNHVLFGERSIIAIIIPLVITSLAQAQSPAKVWEASLTIPTYELGPPDPNPALLDWQRRRWRPVYPYAMLDTLTARRVDKNYKAVFLENEYLRVTVLPELGGRLYAIFDKTTNRDVLYTNHVVKYAIVAIRGAWISGGIEWNFPDGHTLTTVSPVDYVMRAAADGSAEVVVGDTERAQRMQWAIAIRLRPGQKVVETEVRLVNRREVPGRYWYWSTAAAPATADMRFVYPMREAYPHTFWPVFSFPKEKGVDIGTYREVMNDLSLFARNSRRDFFGVYYEKSDWGIVHVADHHELAGKKTWTWGADESGKIWVEKLTDKDGQYVEFQAGKFETQMEHDFIAPHRVEHFTEYWLPLSNLQGGFDEATRDGALHVKLEGRQAHVTANFSAQHNGAELVIESNGKRLRSERVNLVATAPFESTVELPETATGKPLAVSFRTNDGRELIRYRTDIPSDGNSDFKPARRPLPDPVVPMSAEQAYVEGLAADKKSNERAARAAYLEALKRDQGFAPAHVALGLSFYRSGEYDLAAEHLAAALRRNKDAADAHYYLGLARDAQGRSDEAERHLMWCVRMGHRESVARYALAAMALRAGKTGEAVEHLSQAVTADPRDLKARTLLAMAERIAGNLDRAQARIDEVVREVPIDYLALHEQHEILKVREPDSAGRVYEELWRLLAREPDSVLELIFDYGAVGRTGECRSILEEAIRRADRQGQVSRDRGTASQKPRVYPMLHYTLGYLYELGGDSSRAKAEYRLGSDANPAFIFPHRVEEIAALKAALTANPADGRAYYYLGNALASNNRDAEALAAWREAVRLDPQNAVAHRNLARALWLVEGNKEQAETEFERAIRASPDDSHLYIEMDRLLADLGAIERRIKLLEGAPAELRSRPAFVQALASAYVDAGRFADAAGLLERTVFTSGEGEYTALAVYRRAHLGLARRHQQNGRHLEAAAEFIKATQYPANLGVGRPSMESQAREYVAAARELEAAGRGDQAAHLWQRAADDPLNYPTQPEEPWSEHYYFKAVALERIGRREEARALYQRLARLADDERMLEAEASHPQGVIRFLLAGLGLKALAQKKEARAAFQKALELEPENERAQRELNELGQSPNPGGKPTAKQQGNQP